VTALSQNRRCRPGSSGGARRAATLCRRGQPPSTTDCAAQRAQRGHPWAEDDEDGIYGKIILLETEQVFRTDEFNQRF